MADFVTRDSLEMSHGLFAWWAFDREKERVLQQAMVEIEDQAQCGVTGQVEVAEIDAAQPACRIEEVHEVSRISFERFNGKRARLEQKTLDELFFFLNQPATDFNAILCRRHSRFSIE